MDDAFTMLDPKSIHDIILGEEKSLAIKIKLNCCELRGPGQKRNDKAPADVEEMNTKFRRRINSTTDNNTFGLADHSVMTEGATLSVGDSNQACYRYVFSLWFGLFIKDSPIPQILNSHWGNLLTKLVESIQISLITNGNAVDRQIRSTRLRIFFTWTLRGATRVPFRCLSIRMNRNTGTCSPLNGIINLKVRQSFWSYPFESSILVIPECCRQLLSELCWIS